MYGAVLNLKTNVSSGLISGLGSHHKPPILNASQISTTKSTSGVQRNMATVSPLYQVSTAPQAGTVVPIAATHSNSTTCHSVMSNSALAATRTSSFAAALRKLAKQSIDPLIGSDNGQQCSSLGLSVNHSSNASKNSSSSSFQSPYQSSIVAPSPPIVTIAPIPAHQIERSSDLRKSESHSFFDHRIHSDQSKESLLFSHSHRTSPLVHVRPPPSRDHNENGQISASNHSTQSNSQNRSSGFQPYRTGFEDSLRPNSSSSLTSATLPSHLMPYDTLTFPYHPFLPHTPTLSASSAPLSHHVPHPSASYRMEDPFYLDRFNLLRGSLHGGSALTHANSGGTSSVPFNLARYSELLNSQHERILNDERHRLLNHSLSQSAYKPGTQPIDSPPLHLNIPTTTNERLIDNNSEQHLLNHLSHSALNSSGKRDFSVNSSTSGSILSGTPRDHIQSSLSNSIRKPHFSTTSASVKPLNLSSNSEHINSNSEQIYLWRPQSDEDRERITSEPLKNHEHLMEGNNRKNNSLLIEDSIQAKGLRINNFENTNSLIDNRFNDKVIATTKFLPTEKSEGLQTRILENSERSLVNDSSIYSSHWQSNAFRSELTNGQKSPLIRKEIGEEVISKLDLEELKLKQKRLNKAFENVSDSEEDDYLEDSDDNDEDIQLKYRVVLTKRLPLKLDKSPDKMKFLRMFNLTTHKRKSQMEFQKYIKRRKILRESTPEPNTYKTDSIEENKENPQTLSCSQILPDSIASQETNLEVKIHFMSAIGLREQISSERLRDTELLWDGVIRDREMRIKKEKCWVKLLNNLNKEILHKWLSNLQTNYSHYSHSTPYELDISNHFGSNGFIQNCLTNTKYSNNSSRGQRKVILFNKQLNNESTEKRSHAHSHHSSKDFAQEFHESVLLETTKQQMARQELHRHYADLSSSSNFKWPGIEAVMEAYDRYACDQKQEKDFLQEKTQQLKNRLQDMNREAEYLSQKMADLVQTKTQLDDSREQYQSALDSLKKCLKQLR